MTSPAAAPSPAVPRGDEENHRDRLLAAVVRTVVEKGYAGTTVADVVATARVSRRTFYEHFANKDDCFLAAFDHFSRKITARIATAVADVAPWQDRLDAGVGDYVAAALAEPRRTERFLVEVLAIDTRGLRHRRGLHDEWAAVLRREIRRARAADPALAAVSREPGPALALGLVGAVAELTLAAVSETDPWTPGQLASAVVDTILSAGLVVELDRDRLLHREIDLRDAAPTPTRT